MTSDLKNLGEHILDNAPSDVVSIINDFLEKSYTLTMIGGGVRQYLLGGGLPDDLDFEIRHSDAFDEKSWFKKLKKDVNELAQKDGWEVSELKFGVFRLKRPAADHSYELELATPRKEKFKNEKAHLGHSDFEVEVGPHIPYEEAFKRRDFTINAMGCELCLKDGKMISNSIDPFNGQKDLENKFLRPCGDQFFLDPVRFLRMIRFKQKLDFQIEKSLNDEMTRFDLSKLTSHYFLSEGLKGSFFSYCQEFFELTSVNDINIPNGLRNLNFLGADSLTGLHPHSVLEIQGALVLGPSLRILDHEREKFSMYAQIKKNDFKKLIELKTTLLELKKAGVDYLKTTFLKAEFEEVVGNELLVMMKHFHQLQNWIIEKGINPKHFIAQDLLSVFNLYAGVFPGKLKGESHFLKVLSQKNLKGEERSQFRILCHLKEALK